MERLQGILDQLREGKNLILQGPPGTGKTWLAKRLAYALMGEQDDGRLRWMQFHPNYSYEEFVQGLRPTANGLEVASGPMMEMIEVAQADLERDYVMVIEEVNRGNPAQIFGEMLTLLEDSKRGPEHAMRLTYGEGESVWVPENLHVVGTMNTADRSLALVDFALRRRFAFVDLEPLLNDSWRAWMSARSFDVGVLNDIASNMDELNKAITQDNSLGKQFGVGHSYVTTEKRLEQLGGDARAWFRRQVERKIAPLLREYWFDDGKRAEDEASKLLEGF